MENPDDPTYLTIAIVVIVLVALVIGSLFLSVLSEALSCIYIFYCFDKKFHQMGFPIVNNVPQSMRKLFLGLRGDGAWEFDDHYGGNQGGGHSGNQGGGYPGNQGGYQGNQGGYPGNQGGYPGGGYGGNQGGYNQGGYPGGYENQGRPY